MFDQMWEQTVMKSSVSDWRLWTNVCVFWIVRFYMQNALQASCLVIEWALLLCSMRTADIFSTICIIKRDALLNSFDCLFMTALWCFEMKRDNARIWRLELYWLILVSHILISESIKSILFIFFMRKESEEFDIVCNLEYISRYFWKEIQTKSFSWERHIS